MVSLTTQSCAHTGNKKQSTVASSSSPTVASSEGAEVEPAVAESEGDASYPVQEQLHDQEYVIY